MNVTFKKMDTNLKHLFHTWVLLRDVFKISVRFA